MDPPPSNGDYNDSGICIRVLLYSYYHNYRVEGSSQDIPFFLQPHLFDGKWDRFMRPARRRTPLQCHPKVLRMSLLTLRKLSPSLSVFRVDHLREPRATTGVESTLKTCSKQLSHESKFMPHAVYLKIIKALHTLGAQVEPRWKAQPGGIRRQIPRS